MATKINHVHKLKRFTYKKTGTKIFFCCLPDCHFKIEAALALGKRALCNICGEEFIMSEYTIKLIKPHCSNCGKVKVKDSDGATRFVKKVTNKILVDVATETSESLRSRLNSVTSAELEEDI